MYFIRMHTIYIYIIMLEIKCFTNQILSLIWKNVWKQTSSTLPSELTFVGEKKMPNLPLLKPLSGLKTFMESLDSTTCPEDSTETPPTYLPSGAFAASSGIIPALHVGHTTPPILNASSGLSSVILQALLPLLKCLFRCLVSIYPCCKTYLNLKPSPRHTQDMLPPEPTHSLYPTGHTWHCSSHH